MVHAVGAWAPSWVDSLDLPVWVSGPDRTLRHVNPAAERLLGRPVGALLGRPCFAMVRAGQCRSRGSVSAFCAERCPFVECLRRRAPLSPQRLVIAAAPGDRHYALVLALPIAAPDEERPSLVHLAYVMDRAQRLLGYVERLAARTLERGHPEPETALTPRELEVLVMLSRDIAPRVIALHLEISHATVRNHVQHLLRKLGAHSIEEAVALYLMRDHP